MKKHPFLQLECSSSVKIPLREKKLIDQWLLIASEVLESLFAKKIIPTKGLKSLHLSLLICGDARIKKLNNEFRGKDKVTDVLSFPLHENLRTSCYSATSLSLGDIAICYPQMKRQARDFKIGSMDEFIHLFFHGVIHLIGYDHEISEKEEKLMMKWEKLALEKFSEIKKKRAI